MVVKALVELEQLLKHDGATMFPGAHHMLIHCAMTTFQTPLRIGIPLQNWFKSKSMADNPNNAWIFLTTKDCLNHGTSATLVDAISRNQNAPYK